MHLHSPFQFQEKTPESHLDCWEIKPVNSKGNQPWIFNGRADAEAEAPILWPPDVKNWLIGKDPDAGKDWRWEEKGMTEDEMASLTQWTWVWASCRSWWWAEKPRMLQCLGSQSWTPLRTEVGKGVCQGCILSPCLFNLYAEYIMKNAGLEETQAGIKIARRNINNLRYADDT